MNPENRLREAEKQLQVASETLTPDSKAAIASELAGLVAVFRQTVEDDPEHFHTGHGGESSRGEPEGDA